MQPIVTPTFSLTMRTNMSRCKNKTETGVREGQTGKHQSEIEAACVRRKGRRHQ